jgi:hypothetical protein
LAATSQIAWADEAQLNIYGVQLGESNLSVPLGGVGSDSAEPMNQMQAIVNDVPAGPFAISGGSLSFATPNPTSVDTSFSPAYFNYYGLGGGSLTLTGSAFGLPDGSTLLTATFAPKQMRPYGAISTVFVDPTVDLVDVAGLLSITWVNPALLNGLGIGDFPGTGDGSLAVSRSRDPGTGSLDTASGLVLQLDGPAAPAPEPASAFLLGVGFLSLAARRWAGRRTAV